MAAAGPPPPPEHPEAAEVASAADDVVMPTASEAAALCDEAATAGRRADEVPMWLGVPDGGLTEAERRRATTCKIGGKPTFSQTPLGQAAAKEIEEKTKCSVCGDPMFLLVQAFCPVDEMERVLYVFVCNCSHCHCKKDKRAPWKAFRFQERCVVDEEIEEEMEEEDADAPRAVPPAPAGTFPEHAVDTFEEPVTAGTEAEEMKKAESIMSNRELADSITAEDIDDVQKINCVDEAVAKFQARISRCPQQVLRWAVGGRPLWLTTVHQPSVSAIPNCPKCDSRRRFELQLLPTLIYTLSPGRHLKPNATMSDDGLDFGTVAVYTCSNGNAEAEGLFEEYCHVQPVPIE